MWDSMHTTTRQNKACLYAWLCVAIVSHNLCYISWQLCDDRVWAQPGVCQSIVWRLEERRLLSQGAYSCVTHCALSVGELTYHWACAQDSFIPWSSQADWLLTQIVKLYSKIYFTTSIRCTVTEPLFLEAQSLQCCLSCASSEKPAKGGFLC